MDHAEHIGEDAIFNVKNIAKKLTEEKDQEVKDKLYKRFNTLRHDIDTSIKEQKLVEISGRAEKAMEDWEKVKKYVDKIYNASPEELEDAELYLGFIDKLSSYDLYADSINWRSRLYFNARGEIGNINESNMADYQLEAGSEIVQAIAKEIGKKRKFNMLLYCAEFYINSAMKLKEELGNAIDFYGIYESDMYNKFLMNLDARKIFNKVAIGDPSKSIVKNKSIDYCAYRFRFDQRQYDNLTISDLTRIARYMRNGGIVTAYMPSAFLYSKDCTALAKVYDLACSQHMPTKNYDNDVDVTLFVFRAVDNKSPEAVEKTYRELMAYNSEGHRIDIEDDIKDIVSKLPEKEQPALNLFIGEKDDWAIVELVFEESTLHDGIEPKVVNKELHPLLPLKKGQIGQALASGRLDGIIDEGNGIKHLIKGRVYRGSKTTETLDDADPDNAVRTIKELQNNLIDIKLVAGDGTIKNLTLAN